MDESTQPGSVPEENNPISGLTAPSGPPVGFTTPAAEFKPVAPLTERRANESIFWIERTRIQPNPYQPRREFDEASLKDLAESIRTHGMLQPILVSRVEVETPRGMEVKYQLIAGERRLRAAGLAGMEQVPVIIKKEPTDRMKLELALIENVQREDLNPIERAKAFRQLIDDFKLMQREVAERVGKSREMVANTLRLLSLPIDMQQAIADGKMTEGHARAVLMVGDNLELQRQIFNQIMSGKLTVRETENEARRLSGRTLTPRKRFGSPGDPETRDWQSKLQELLGTKVLVQKIGDRGKIVIEFYSDEELRAIIDKVLQERGDAVQSDKGKGVRRAEGFTE
ncbi:MAG: ParB/RepB/Spo0J family partition protein [Candidatus Sungbacteria bacterium]|uniref:ParB/RepB/Spo0J family partition protein n=1 Tax=Candidatus Sungiibacteriota bacterium TaxID=2750080 RepID=A0A931SEB5_9BACT|nr:ParB/RepB/Spo0J family partition protein [Candidatus Sungbacteria bacterium]